MDKYECEGCGYVYDEAKGETGLNIKRGKTFESLSDSIVCSVYGASKNKLVKL